jgi:hypothetical protein
MRQPERVPLRVAVPALLLLIWSSLWVAGAQRPGQLPVDADRPRIVTVETEGEASPPAGDDTLLLRTVSDSDCVFVQDPRPFLEGREVLNARRTSEINRVIRWTVSANGTTTGLVDPNNIARNNFIDEEIFSRMAAANIRSAPVTGDAEFLRRVSLDLTGRIPAAADVTNFLADTSSLKRAAAVDALIASPEFTDKWTLFFGDLFQNNVTSTQVTRGVQARDVFYTYLKTAIGQNMPYDVLARNLITGAGDSFAVGQANWAVGNTVSMGPVQDTYDGAAVDLGNMFMGISSVDCLLCHDGTRHLDQVNLWGASQTRQNLWGLAAYFSQTRMQRNATVGSTVVSDDPSLPGYRLNTNNGNRTPRQPLGTLNNIPPRYPFGTSANPGGGILTGETRRQAIARQITADLQFSRAAVNYVWQKLMGEAFVTPANGFDLARLDPNNPPPAPWTLQPTNPVLLDRLARYFQSNGYNIRLLIGAIVKSNAYQLSSTYNGEWSPGYVPYYARHYVRRLDSEEILDAISKATNIPQTYTMAAPSTLPPVQWAGQLPDTREPTGTATTPTPNGTITAFLNAFGRGDRDVNPRRFDGSVQQGLTVMNNAFLMNRIHNANAGSRVNALLQASTDPAFLIRQLYLHTLSRPATDEEVNSLLPTFQQQMSPTTGYRTPTENLRRPCHPLSIAESFSKSRRQG